MNFVFLSFFLTSARQEEVENFQSVRGNGDEFSPDKFHIGIYANQQDFEALKRPCAPKCITYTELVPKNRNKTLRYNNVPHKELTTDIWHLPLRFVRLM